jgi:4-hydroxy-4-methyl-2-oxoglutarate aldolase
MPSFVDDSAKFEFMEQKLYTAVLSDIMDSLGLKDRVMEANIRPLSPDHVVAGNVRTILWGDVYEVYDHPYKVEIEAMDSLQPGDVVVHCAHSKRSAPWGALMTAAAMARGARGAVMDGCVRDVKQIIRMGFPVFSAGIRPLDSKGRTYVFDYDCPIECGGVEMKSGDLILADYDGVVVLPREREEEVLTLAAEKVEKENLSIRALRSGRYLRDVYEEHGVL